jgi:hypothetical protein
VLFKWRINVSSVRTLTRDADFDAFRSSGDGTARSVAERRIERRRPSGKRTTTKAGPRPDRLDTSSRR